MDVNIEAFFKTVEDIKSLIESISSQAEEVEKRQAAILAGQKNDKGNTKELEKLSSEIKKNSGLVQAKLKSMQNNLPTDENCQCPSVFGRIYKNQHSHLTRCFVDVMRSYYRVQTDFREKCKAQIQRQLEIVDQVTTDEDLEEMLNCDSLSIFISGMKSDSRLSSQALNEIEDRHIDIMSLESSMREMHEIFTDTALLLETQGELINNIEKNVTGAAEYVDKSKVESDKAIAYKKNSFKLVTAPNFLRSFRRRSKTDTGQSTSNT